MRQLLVPDSYSTDITALTMSNDMHFCRSDSEVIGEPEGHLSKIEVRNSSHILSRDRVILSIRGGQTNNRCGSRFSRPQLQVRHKNPAKKLASC